jgi:hypothetical protein
MGSNSRPTSGSALTADSLLGLPRNDPLGSTPYRADESAPRLALRKVDHHELSRMSPDVIGGDADGIADGSAGPPSITRPNYSSNDRVAVARCFLSVSAQALHGSRTGARPVPITVFRMDQQGWLPGAFGALCVVALFCVAACFGGFLLVGGRYQPCVPGRTTGITVEELAGRYVTSRGAQLVLDTSGTFTARDIAIEFENRPMTLAGPGTWSLSPGGDGFGDIDLSFNQARVGASLSISGSRTEPWLYRYIGDPDSCRIQRFVRA